MTQKPLPLRTIYNVLFDNRYFLCLMNQGMDKLVGTNRLHAEVLLVICSQLPGGHSTFNNQKT